VRETSEPDRISIEFPGTTPAEAAIIARECAQALQQAGLDADSIQVARSERDAMDLGGVLVVLGWAFLEGFAKGTGESAGKSAWRAAVKGLRKLPEAVERVLEAISKRHRTPAQIQGAAGTTWTIGSEFRRVRLPSEAAAASGFGTLGIVILGASEFPYMNDATLNNTAFKRSAALAKSLFSPPNTAFARTAVLDLFDTEMQPLDVLDAIERHLDAHPDMRDLLIYYCGHGSFHQDSTYFLLLRTTRADRAMATGFSPRTLRNDIGPRLLDRRVYFVVDACFSGSFVESLQSSALDHVVRDQLALDVTQSGWSVLTASAKDKYAMAPRGETYTMFTGALAHVITNGVNSAGVRFNLYDLAEEARRYLVMRWQRQAVMPQCISPMQGDGDVGRLPIFLNRERAVAERAADRGDAGTGRTGPVTAAAAPALPAAGPRPPQGLGMPIARGLLAGLNVAGRGLGAGVVLTAKGLLAATILIGRGFLTAVILIGRGLLYTVIMIAKGFLATITMVGKGLLEGLRAAIAVLIFLAIVVGVVGAIVLLSHH
jgi:hypothetical protein